MASTFGATYSAPDPMDFATGQTVKEEATAGGNDVNLQRLRNASNYLGARLRCQPVVSQGWYNSAFQHTSTGGVLNTRCRWRIPRISAAHTAVWCAARMTLTGAGGDLRFFSVNAAASRDIAIPASASVWYTIATALPVAFTAGALDYEEIQLLTAADAGAVLTVHEVTVWYADLSSPLTAGRYATGTEAWETIDDDEVAHGESLNAYLARKFGNNVEAFAARPRTYGSWSAVQDSVPSVLTNTVLTRMTTALHSWLAVPNVQQDLATRSVRYYVRMGDPAALVDTDLYITAGEMGSLEHPLFEQFATRLNSLAAAGTVWLTGNLPWVLIGDLDPRLHGPFRMGRILADTANIAAGAGARHVYSMSFWGQ